MASEIGKIVHCKICGTPIVAKGNRLFCPVCYNQNRRNAAQRSNARTKVQREQMKREEEKMKQNNSSTSCISLSRFQVMNPCTLRDGMYLPEATMPTAKH